MNRVASSMIALAESGRLPDSAIRAGMRKLLRSRLQQISGDSLEVRSKKLSTFIDELSTGPVAAVPEKANEQHYEVPADFFIASLGKHLKYSCCYWDSDTQNLDQAESNALHRTCHTAELMDGQTILELGCGWGSLTLWMAEHFPNSVIHAVSNSTSQKAYIDQQAQERGFGNVMIHTCDINDFEPTDRFDRIVSVEMFEHVRNHSELMRRVAAWLLPKGKLFVHIFCHDRETYPFEDEGASSWMARNFFSGGIMPAKDLLLRYQKHMALEEQVIWDGTHYEKTSNAWLETMDRQTDRVEACFKGAYGADWRIWRQRWRMFYMACAELFGFNNGNEWYVSHYRFCKK